jgi:hypothetical protein
MKDFNSGDKVLARCANGKTRKNIVWEADGSLVYLCSERQYEALSKGEEVAPPIGFPVRDLELIGNDKH